MDGFECISNATKSVLRLSFAEISAEFHLDQCRPADPLSHYDYDYGILALPSLNAI